MKNRPASVNICGIEYKIVYHDNNLDVGASMADGSYLGMINDANKTISIYTKNQPEGAIWQTLWHEILHGIANHMNIRSLIPKNNEDDEEHQTLDVLSVAISDTLIRNGWITTKFS